MSLTLVVDPFPSIAELDRLWRAAWGEPAAHDFERVLARSLGHVGAMWDERLVGFVNVATDGGVHSFILDTCVDPDVQRRGIATALVKRATTLARERGALWLHVDFVQELEPFYRACGFAPTRAGLIDLRDPS